jgi:hypothetical protein
MSKHIITIVTRYEVELENLERDRISITEGYEVAVLPSFIDEESVEYLDGSITYEEATK